MASSEGCNIAKPAGTALTEGELREDVALLRALAHPVRLRIIDLIQHHGGELCVCEFERYFDLTQPTISHHLKILREAGLIRSRQDGTWVRHMIEGEGFERISIRMQALGRSSETA